MLPVMRNKQITNAAVNLDITEQIVKVTSRFVFRTHAKIMASATKLIMDTFVFVHQDSWAKSANLHQTPLYKQVRVNDDFNENILIVSVPIVLLNNNMF